MSGITSWSVPSTFRRTFNGMCRIRHNKEYFVVAWYDCFILMLSENITDSVCCLKVKTPVQNVFQSDACTFCLDKSGCIYTLGYIKNEEDIDIFSSDDEMHSVSMEKSFIPSVFIKHNVCVGALQSGFVVLSHTFGKLYIDLYSNVSDNTVIKKSSCLELCIMDAVFTKGCVLKVCRYQKMVSELQQQFVKMSCGRQLDIVFIGLSTGHVYSIAVCPKTMMFVSKPEIIYAGSSSVFEIVGIEDEHQLYSKIGIVLTNGLMVMVSPNATGSLLQYEVSHLPSYPTLILEMGKSFVFGNGIDLWHCTTKKNDTAMDNRLLNIKGVDFVLKHSACDQILVATVHHTFYVLSLVTYCSNIVHTPACQVSVDEISQSLYTELNQMDTLRKEIVYEDDLISAMSISSRGVVCKQWFSELITIQNISSMSLEHLLRCSGYSDFEEVVKGKQSLANLFLISVVLENKSDIEFSPLVWFVKTSVTRGNETIQKCEKLMRSFSSNINFSTSLCVHIDQPFLGVSISISLITDLPGTTKSKTGPWLIVPVLDKDIEIAQFLSPNYNHCVNSFETLTDKIAHLMPNKNQVTTSLIKYFEKSILTESHHVYEFFTCSSEELIEIWSIIKNNLKHAFTGQMKHAQVNKLALSCGSSTAEITLCKRSVQISSQNPCLLHCLKNIITNKWVSHSNVTSHIFFSGSILPRVLLYKEKLQVEKMDHKISEFGLFKMSWRHFVSENLFI